METTCAFLQRKGEPAGAFGAGFATAENIIGFVQAMWQMSDAVRPGVEKMRQVFYLLGSGDYI